MALIENGKRFMSILVVIHITQICLGFKQLLNFDPDTHKSLPELITSKGYPVEEHDVTTKDGYILGISRIPRGAKHQDDGRCRPPILLHHGFAGSGVDFVINAPDPKKSLGFLLADAGYDVWIANARGNTYSKKHIKYTSDDPKFWEFSLDEVALFDLPAVIDYILETTNREQLIFIGHSMGTTVAFAMLSEFQEYNSKVKAFISLGSVVYMEHFSSPLKLLLPFRNQIANTLNKTGHYEIFPMSVLRNIFTDVVSRRVLIREWSSDMWFDMCGGATSQINKTRFPVYIHHFPAGSSLNSFVHYGQMVASKEFKKFDYGKTKNIKVYGQEKPPKYKVEAITTPIALFWSDSDTVTPPADSALLASRVKNLIINYRVPLTEFAHPDFLFGMDASKLVYVKVISVLESFKN